MADPFVIGGDAAGMCAAIEAKRDDPDREVIAFERVSVVSSAQIFCPDRPNGRAMADSMVTNLERDMECEDLLECFHGLKALDRRVFRTLVEAEEPLTVDGIAEQVDRERSTAYRAVQRLLQAGFIQKEQVNYEQGGYHHVYLPVEASRIADEMQRTLNDWYAKMGQLIQEFEDEYADRSDVGVTAER